jgi:hypothetical protein
LVAVELSDTMGAVEQAVLATHGIRALAYDIVVDHPEVLVTIESLLVCSRKHHGIVQCGWPLQGDIGVKWFLEANGKQLNLLHFSEAVIAARHHHDAVTVLLNRARVSKQGKLTEGVSINGGSNLVLMSWTKRCHVGMPPLSSRRWNHSCAMSRRWKEA